MSYPLLANRMKSSLRNIQQLKMLVSASLHRGEKSVFIPGNPPQNGFLDVHCFIKQ